MDDSEEVLRSKFVLTGVLIFLLLGLWFGYSTSNAFNKIVESDVLVIDYKILDRRKIHGKILMQVDTGDQLLIVEGSSTLYVKSKIISVYEVNSKGLPNELISSELCSESGCCKIRLLKDE